MKILSKFDLRNPSIKVKFFTYLLCFSLFLLILLWLLQTIFLDDIYKITKTQEIQNIAKTIEIKLFDDDIVETLENITDKYMTPIEVNIVDESSVNGKIILTNLFSSRFGHKPNPYNGVLFYEQAKQNGGKFLEIYRDNIYLTQIIKDSQGSVYVITLQSMIVPVEAIVDTLKIQLVFVTIVMILVAIILSLLVSKNIAKPIIAINESAKILATGQYKVTFSAEGYKEIIELSDTLNYAAKELSKVEDLRKELIANISHDLRTPLTLITGYAEAIRDLPGEDTPENVQVIIYEAKRLSSLVEDLLELSKTENTIKAMKFLQYNFTQSVKKVVESFSELTRNEGYIIEFVYEEEIYITADESKMSQVLYNLIINAINYTGEDKKVIITQKCIENKLRIEISDSGIGIEPNELPYIWERYYSSKRHHNRGLKGTGLGLSIVKSIISLHDGQVGVETCENKGSIFWFEIKTD